ncbi:MAG: RICIN domain-containing protein [Bacteroidales bacterium]
MKRAFTLLIALLLAMASAKAQTPTEMPTGKKFYIQSAMNYGKNNGGYWDVPGYPKEIQKGSNIQVYDLDEGHDRTFIFHFPYEGYYEIQIGNTPRSRIDIQGAGKDNGTSVKTWERNNKSNQKFLFEHLGNGRFKIYDRNSGKAICLAGRKNANRTNVHIWENHNGPWMEWYLIDVKTKKAFVPKPVSKTPDFFIDNKNFILKNSYIAGPSEESRVTVESINGNIITLNNIDKNSKLKIEYKNGKYIYDPGGLAPGKPSEDGKKLSFSGEYAADFIVSAPHASQTPDFFINNKKFKYETASMVSRSEGTATVESIDGKKITLRVVGTSYNSDVPPGHPKEKDFDRNIEITFENGKYLYMPDVFSKGEISDNGKTLSFSGQGHIGFTVDN